MTPQKIVINRCFGGFSISRQAAELMATRGSKQAMAELAEVEPDERAFRGGSEEFDYEFDRTDPILVAVVEELGKLADGSFAKLKIIEIPDDVKWEISNRDGMEVVEELHQIWW